MALCLLVGGAFVAPIAQAEPGRMVAPKIHRAPTAQVNVQVHVRMAKRQQNQARAAYRRGEIQSFATIRRSVMNTYQGRIIGTKFVERPKAPIRYVYMFRVLGPDGKVSVVHVNAKNANIIQVRGTR